ncbi:MAG TPA: glucose 1-dehydrogenase [Alphaproteobacteria bacterium]|nr:glucose 1-dehydrogenase [Alphaproteobacteria bacterium]
MLLASKVAIVTGGARGIGAAISRLFAREGAAVAIADRRADEGEETARIIGDKARFVSLDVTSEDGWTKAVAEVETVFGRVDILINNAGIIRVAPMEKLDAETFRKVIDTNLIGTFLGMRAVLEPMRRAGGGAIVNFSSVQGLEGRQGFTAYSASKFGIRGLTKSAAIELGPYGIRVNAVVPGPTKTKMTERPGWTDADYDAAYGKYPLGRMAEAREIAEMALFLACDKSSFCTGGDFVVDGGVTVGKPRD